MAGSATDAYSIAGITQTSRPERGFFEHIINWTSSSGGSVTYTTSNIIYGILIRVVTIPDAVAPTDNYDINSLLVNGIDILNGTGINRDTANSEELVPTVAATDGTNTGTVFRKVSGLGTLDISNAGNAKKGQIVLHMKGD